MDTKIAHPSDFCVLNGDPTRRLSDFERLTLLGSSGLDRAVSWFGKQFASLSLESLSSGLTAQGVRAAIDHAAAFELSELAAPPQWTESSHAAVQMIHGVPNGGVYDIEFASAFSGRLDTRFDDYLACTENRTVHARLWEHSPPAPATVVAIHGWSMGDQRLNSLAFVPGVLFGMGLNVVLVELPFHGRRKPAESPQFVFPSIDIVRTNLAVLQILSDLRQTADVLRGRGHRRIGCIGLSLGAYVGALWSTRDHLDFGISVVPLVSMAELAWELIRGALSDDALKSEGITKRSVVNAFAVHSPLERVSATAEERLLVLSGRGDQIVPRKQIALLKDKRPHANYRWLSGGHGAHFKRGESMRIIREFLERVGACEGHREPVHT